MYLYIIQINHGTVHINTDKLDLSFKFEQKHYQSKFNLNIKYNLIYSATLGGLFIDYNISFTLKRMLMNYSKILNQKYVIIITICYVIPK